MSYNIATKGDTKLVRHDPSKNRALLAEIWTVDCHDVLTICI